jgi:hypothetical protein
MNIIDNSEARQTLNDSLLRPCSTDFGFLPTPFGMCTRRTGGARLWSPTLAQSSQDARLFSRFTAQHRSIVHSHHTVLRVLRYVSPISDLTATFLQRHGSRSIGWRICFRSLGKRQSHKVGRMDFDLGRGPLRSLPRFLMLAYFVGAGLDVPE